VLNRKNALFAGHDEGAENWACIASLIETCKLNDVEPQACIADGLNRLVNLWAAARVDELMPRAWTKANAPINSPPDPPRLKLSRQFQRAGARKGRLP
jgi:hypothetical protein